MMYELWVEREGEQTFCLAGPLGKSARQLLAPRAKLAWTSEASSYFEAITKYYEYMGWGEYKSDSPEENKKPTPN
ncbi:hypothetical protein [Pleionea sp. CnH1-48]|uniref:hypothetical protein n=1 Tax=Pleionea sp. CnH1-48 TaxID=2954494 RepID=UPI002096B2E9|nr:hypothetical protein [Pleionea sp. CnH1-48]MCO7226968.1 hypothetical protein [Pleionea sp. CnH1-48]